MIVSLGIMICNRKIKWFIFHECFTVYSCIANAENRYHLPDQTYQSVNQMRHFEGMVLQNLEKTQVDRLKQVAQNTCQPQKKRRFIEYLIT